VKKYLPKEKNFPELEEAGLPIIKSSIKHLSPRRGQFKITVRKVDSPIQDDFENNLVWICSSLGFFEEIDKEKNAARIWKEILLSSAQGQVLTSTSIAERIGMSRGSVINHLNNLTRAGLIQKGGRYYYARSASVKKIMEELEDEVSHIFSRLKNAGEKIDKELESKIQLK
jgi:predicted transcriptional regulator